MMDVEKYLDDGANWQAQAVLAFIRSNTHIAIGDTYNSNVGDYLVKINVGRYENCREQGYVFSISFVGKNDYHQRNYAVYEHRNSDRLTVLISNAVTVNTPNIDAMWTEKGENASKYDCDKFFEYGEIIECGKYILSDMRNFIKAHFVFNN